MHAWAAVTAPAAGVHAADVLGQLFVRPGAGAPGLAAPGMIAAGADMQHRTHGPHGEHLAVALMKRNLNLGGIEKMPTALFGMPRSVCARSGSFCKRRISACSADSAATVPGRTADAACPAWFARLRQRRSTDGSRPSSDATCAKGRPLSRSRATASRLNSSVNSRRVFFVVMPRVRRRGAATAHRPRPRSMTGG